MGISSNQARFLALTARQVDLENRVQQICQRRLRLASELERVATEYNNSIGNRKMFTQQGINGGINPDFSIANIQAIKDTNGNLYKTLSAGATDGTYVSIADTDIATLKSSGTVTPTGGKAITLTDLGLTTSASTAQILEAAIRLGKVSIATQADQFTQTKTTVGTTDYEIKDWRTLTFLSDELYKGDDADAETKYDTTVANINSQDKKLQLEQSSVEVEYKAVASEKEAVKKILDTNATSSFKYFS